jgi:hypothetical protein
VKILSSLLSFLVVTSQSYAQVAPDTSFIQEYHEPLPVSAIAAENEIRKLAIDKTSTVWIATPAGVLSKSPAATAWKTILKNDDDGPAFAVYADPSGNTWIGNWKGIFLASGKSVEQVDGTTGPVSVICDSKEGIYAAGPNGIWLYDGNKFRKTNYTVSRSIRSMFSDGSGGLWIASDVGLYHCMPKRTEHFVTTDKLVSAYVRGVEKDKGNNIWAACLGGVSVLSNNIRQANIGVTEGCPSIYINCIRQAPDGSMWVGTQVGVVRFHPDGTHTLRFSRRWLLDDNVQDIQFDDSGTAYIATPKGVSVIRQLDMTLSSKQDYFYKILMERHIRAPWIAGQAHLRVPGDLSSWQPDDDDNDGEFTGNYLTMESFRYAATKDEDARTKAKKAFNFLKLLEEVTGGDGYFARTIVPVDWKFRMHDTNRQYTKYELAEELVKEPRYKPIEVRWRKSKDGKWLWKGDASSDEWCGHMMGYYFYYELAADAAEKEIVRNHVARLMDHLIANNYNMMDIDGTHTRWSVWSPDDLNRNPEWQPDRFQNSMEILAFLKLAYYMTGKEKYQQHYLKLINQEHYLDNMKNLMNQNPAWFIYYDVTMQAYLFPILMHCEKDPAIRSTYSSILNAWMDRRRNDHNPLINFLYCYASNKKEELVNSIEFLKDTPLDLVDWNVDHTKREDVRLVRSPVLDDLQVNELPPPSIRTAVRWDKNPWSANNGYPDMEREPVFWLLPYWMGRYLEMIEK